MEELRIDDDMTKFFFITAFKDGNIVPILGAGFTVGMPARGTNVVPSGKQLKSYMIKQIAKAQSGISEEELAKETFSSVADLFESTHKDIKGMGVARYFEEHFMGVKIQENGRMDIKLHQYYLEPVRQMMKDDACDSDGVLGTFIHGR